MVSTEGRHIKWASDPMAVGLATVVATTAIALIMLTSAALADGPEAADPSKPFTPQLDVSANDYTAGAHPDFAIGFSKPENKCAVPEPGGPSNQCKEENTDEQQDFKKISVVLPEGLVADPNAAPACNVEENALFGTGLPRYFCNPPVPAIGKVSGFLSNCSTSVGPVLACGNPAGYDPNLSVIFGQVYLGERRANLAEQAHLILFIGLTDQGIPFPEIIKVDISVSVDPSGRITASVDNLPDVAPISDLVFGGTTNFPAQFHDVTITLFGDVGADQEHAAVTNPTSCSKRQLTAEAQGYAYTPYYDSTLPDLFKFAPGFGAGKTVTGLAADYPVRGCNSLPYAPTFDLDLDPATPSATPAITSTITQARGEQTTGSVSVTFPKDFQINFENQNAQCTQAQFNSRICPAASVIGSASADSDLLPIGSGPLTGNVYLGETDFTAGNIKLFMDLANDFLPGGIRLTGNTRIEADGSLKADFDQVPELPIKSFTLNLEGGDDKALLRNPKNCGTQQIESAFTSHQGKIVKREVPVDISCEGEASFDVTLSNRTASRHPEVGLEIGSATPIGQATFTVSRFMRRERCRNLENGRSYGAVTYTTDEGLRDAKLVLLKCTRKGSLRLSATKGGAKLGSARFYKLKTTSSRKKRTVSKRGSKRGAKKRRSPKLRFGLTEIPEGARNISLELFNRDQLLRNPGRCKHRKRRGKDRRVRMSFSATFTDSGGTHILSKKIRVRCQRSPKG